MNRLGAAPARARKGAYLLPVWWTDEAGVCACPKGASCPSPGKHPLLKHGVRDASANSSTIEGWRQRWPLANWAERTDEVHRIDIDLVEVAEALANDVALRNETEVVRTPRGGLHIAVISRRPTQGGPLYLQDGRKLGDLKAGGGYVLIPPSRVGNRPYQSLSPDHGRVMTVDDPRQWLAKVLPSFGFALGDEGRGKRQYAALGGTIYEGEGRHDALVSYAGRVWVEGMCGETLAALLQEINERQCRPPLPDDELSAIVDHFVAKRERRSPSSTNTHDPAVVPPQLGPPSNGRRGDGRRATPLEESTTPEPEAAATAQPFEAKSLDTLLAEEDQALDVVVSDGADGAILTADGKGLIAGPTGVGKTGLLLRLGRCLGEGSPFLGLAIPRPRRVLYLALEGSERGMRRRLRKVWAGAEPEARQRFTLAQITFSLASEDDLNRLEALLYAVRPEVLIIDPLRNAHPFDENASHEAARLTAILDGIIARHRCAIICAHHDRKRPPFVRRDVGTDRVRGSTALTGWLSFCLSIDPDPKTPDLLLAEWTKTRDAELPLPSLVLEFDRDTLDFIPTDRAPGGKVSDDTILNAVFHAAGTIRGPDLVRGLVEGCGAGERSVRERIRALVKEGKLIDFVAEADRVTRAKSYRLADSEEDE